MTDLEKLKFMIDEKNYPYFEDSYLQKRLEEEKPLNELARELCIKKAGIEEIKLGDVIIPSPRKYFLMLAQEYRTDGSRVVVRADEQ